MALKLIGKEEDKVIVAAELLIMLVQEMRDEPHWE